MCLDSTECRRIIQFQIIITAEVATIVSAQIKET